MLVIFHLRGILPDNIDNDLQLTHFTTLQLEMESLFDANVPYDYDLQRMFRFISSFMS